MKNLIIILLFVFSVAKSQNIVDFGKSAKYPCKHTKLDFKHATNAGHEIDLSYLNIFWRITISAK